MALAPYEEALEAHLNLYREMATTKWQRHVGDLAQSLADMKDIALIAMHKDLDRFTVAGHDRLSYSGTEAHGVLMRLMGMPEDRLGAEISKRWSHPIAKAETFYVTPHMCATIYDRLENSNLQRTIKPHHLISDTGFVYLGQPYFAYAPESNFSNVMREEARSTRPQDFFPVRAFAWMPHPSDPSRLMSLWFVDRKAPEHKRYMAEQIRAQKKKWAQMQGLDELPEPVIVHHNGRDMTFEEAETARMPERFLLDSLAVMSFDSDSPYALQAETNRMLCMTILMLGEPIGRVSGVAPMTRWLKKDAKRRLPGEGDINVIYLRKEVNKDPDLKALVEGGREFTYRHHVRSHYRRYWVGSGEERHTEWRKVRDHWRGEGLPTVATENVYVLKK